MGLVPHSQCGDYAMNWTIQGSNLNRDKTFSILQNAQTFYGAHQPPIHKVPGFFLAIKRMGHEINHSSAPSVEVKNERSYTSSSPVYCHVTERDSFTFTSVACGKKYKSLCNFLQFFFISFSHLNILLRSDYSQNGCSQKLMRSVTGLQLASPYRHFSHTIFQIQH